MKAVAFGLGLILAGTAAMAQAVDTRTARKMLFSERGHVVQVTRGMSETDAATVRAIVPLMADQMRQPVTYYAAIAWSPADGMVHDSLQAALNHHTPQAAGRAAITACNALRSEGAPGCEVAAYVLPKGYNPQPLSLSLSATAAFNGTYRKARGPKAFAISPSLGSWAMGADDATALADCARQSGATDCEIVIRD